MYYYKMVKSMNIRCLGENNRGIVLLITVLLIVFIAVGMVAFLDIATIDFQLLQNNRYSEEALYIAQAGIEDVIARLRNNINYQTVGTVVPFSGHQYLITCPQPNPPKIITSTATLSNGYKREIETSVQVFGTSAPYKVIINYWKEI
ncbi:MAG TPA: hypothetical protein ENH40_00375 [Nitrospirae bacterium]|nr:hypothetical protein [Nitrospirota bacterium]